MKTIPIAVALSVVGIASAMAADMSGPAPSYIKAPLVTPTYSWTGCYLGVNGGYGWNSGHTTYRDDTNAPNADPINHVAPDPFGFTEQFIATPAATGGSGGLAGGGAGCDLQSQRWVLGIEADIDWAHISGRNTTSTLGQFGVGPGAYTSINDTGTANEQVSLRWLSTFRARAGIAVQDRVLLFATGGFAVGDVNSQGSVTTSSPFPGFTNPAWTGSSSTVKAGGVVGAGIEWAFYDRWTAKAEYLWYDLGNVSHPLNCTGLPGCGTGALYPTLGNASSPALGSIVRAGINYRF
jgi:outer membrane immunogenic protein